MNRPSLSISSPKHKKISLLSGQYINQGNGNKGNAQNQQPVNHNSNFSMICDSSNTIYPLNGSILFR